MLSGQQAPGVCQSPPFPTCPPICCHTWFSHGCWDPNSGPRVHIASTHLTHQAILSFITQPLILSLRQGLPVEPIVACDSGFPCPSLSRARLTHVPCSVCPLLRLWVWLTEGLGCSSVTENLLSLFEGLSSIPSSRIKQNRG